MPLNLKIQAGGLHSLHPHSTKCFTGRAEEGEWRKGGGSTPLVSERRPSWGWRWRIIAKPQETCWEPLPQMATDLGNPTEKILQTSWRSYE